MNQERRMQRKGRKNAITTLIRVVEALSPLTASEGTNKGLGNSRRDRRTIPGGGQKQHR